MHCPKKPETDDTCSAGPNPNTLTPSQKHPASPNKTIKPNTIYIPPGYKMVSSLNPIRVDNGSHHQSDIIDNIKDENRHKLEPKPTQHIPYNRIHPIEIEAITASSIHRNMHVRTTDIANYPQRTPLFALSLPPKSPTTDHSAILTTPTTPYLPTADNPWTSHPSSAPHGTIRTATTASDNHPVTPPNELHRYSTLLHPQSQFENKTNQPNDAETQNKMRSSITHTVITTAVAPTTACNTQPNGETYTRHDTNDTPQAFWAPTDVAYTFTTTAQFPTTALVAHLQRLFHPPPMLCNTTSIWAQPFTTPIPMDSSRHHHYSQHPHQHSSIPTCDHKTLALAAHTTTTTAATDGLQKSKIPKKDEKEDPK